MLYLSHWRVRALVLTSTMLFVPMTAQVAPPPVAPAAAGTADEVLVLSPFEVSATKDTGYQASSTLAGTRLNTPLSDVGAPITAITKEFLQDTGVTDINQLFLYTVSTEGSGLEGNFSATAVSGEFPDQTASRQRPQSATRVRGLVGADLTRDYFLSTIPLEDYNVERIDISRGPNAILFGLGSPGGVANSTLLKASYNKDAYSLSLRYGDHDSYRSVLDLNQVLIPKKLAARVAFLNKETHWQQNPTFERDNRIYATMKANPFENTTLHVNYENGEVKGRRPQTVNPRDRMAMWYIMGKPTWDASIQVPNQTGERDKLFPADGQPSGIYDIPNTRFAFPAIFTQYGIPYEVNGTSQIMAGFMGLNQGLTNPNTPGVPAVNYRFMAPRNTGDFGGNLRNQGVPISLFNFRDQLLSGETGYGLRDFDAANISLEQHFLNHQVGVEVAYSKERYNEFFSEPFGIERLAGIDIDLNTKLVDGRVNPNFGRPYIAAWENGDKRARVDQEAVRATAYGIFDFADRFKSGFARWLGRHTLTAFASSQKSDKSNSQNRLGWIGGDVAFDLNETNIVNQARAVVNLIYVGPSLANLTSEDQVHLDFNLTTRLTQPGDTRDVVYWDRQTSSYQTGQFKAVEGVISALKQKQEIESQAAILQSYWLKDSLVTTVGWRKDKSTSYSSTTTPRFTSGDLQGSIDLNQLALSPTPIDVVKGEIKTYSAVARPPAEFKLPFGIQPSIHYSQSENFQPLSGQISIFGTKLPPPTGKTKEYGFTLATRSNRASVKFNWYETELRNAASGSGVDSGYVATLLRVDLQTAGWWYDGVNAGIVGPTMPTQADIDKLIGSMPQTVLDMVGYKVVPDTNGKPTASYSLPTNVTDVTNLAAKGLEIEGVLNLTPNWRVAFNVAKQQTQKADTASFVEAYIEQRKPIWESLRHLNRVPTLGDDPLPDSFGRSVIAQAYQPLAGLQANDGAYSPELRKWRFNFINNYTFNSDSKLKGLGIGGAWRWQDKAAIDYPTILDADGVRRPDVAHPYYAPSESQIDLWVSYTRPFTLLRHRVRQRIQLNVGNILAKDDLIPVTMHGFGVPAYVRVAPPRTWFLTSTLEY